MIDHKENSQTPIEILKSKDAIDKIMEGLNLAADVVGSTMGPAGKNVVIRNDDGTIVVTRDGVTVANSIKFQNKVMDIGAELLKQAAQKTNDTAGDGTTTSTVLTRSLVQEGLKLLAAGFDSNQIRDGIEYAVNKITQNLNTIAIKISEKEDLKKVAKISANGDDIIANIVSDAVYSAGPTGIINVEEAKSVNTTLEFLEGLKFDSGYLSPYFINDQTKNCVSLENCFVLVSEDKISTLKSLIPILEEVHKNRYSLLIIADDVEGDALQGLILNKVKTGLNIVAVKSPYYGKRRTDFIKDIAAVCGTTVYSENIHGSLEKCSLKDLCGRTTKIIVDSKSTTIINKIKNQEVENRKETINEELTDPTLSKEEQQFLRERYAKISNGVAVIKVGGVTELETKEKIYRIEDAVHATREAFISGVLPGGGVGLFIASHKIFWNIPEEFKIGSEVVLSACLSPMKRIAENSGKSPDVVVDWCLSENYKDGFGYNPRENKYVHMIDSGVLDPLNVTKFALQNAASVASIILSLDSVIY